MTRKSRYEGIHDKYQTTSNRKLGVKYERLAALVFKTLEKRGVVIHDRKLIGESGTESQIDVIAEDRDNKERRILVECKDFDVKSKPVGIDVVRCFWAVVDDIKPTDSIIVTCKDFTAPAVQYAAHKKIKLGILRQITDEDLAGLITEISINFSCETTSDVSMELLFPNEEMKGEFQRCLRENGIREISSTDSEVYLEVAKGEISDINEFVNTKVVEYRKDNPTDEYGIIQVDLSGSSVKVKDIAAFPINAVEIKFLRNKFSTKLTSYSEKIAEMIFRILEDGGEDVIIFEDDLEHFQIDSVTHEVSRKPEVAEIPGWDELVVRGTTFTWTKMIGNTFLRIGYSKDQATEEYVTIGLILPSPPQEQWLIKDGMRYEWVLEQKDYQRIFSGEFVDTHSLTGDVIAEDVSTPPKMAAYLEKTAAHISQPLRDRIIWILAECGGKMERSRLRNFTGRDYPILDPIFGALEKEGKIKITGEIIILMQ